MLFLRVSLELLFLRVSLEVLFLRVSLEVLFLRVSLKAAHRAAASWELVVISMASWTLFCRASRVRWSTGSTDWMSTLLITSRFWEKHRSERTASFSSKPNTAEKMIRLEF